MTDDDWWPSNPSGIQPLLYVHPDDYDETVKYFKEIMGMPARVESEAEAQKKVATYLDFLGVLWTHVPNEGKRNIVAGSRLKQAGMKRGVPDVLIFHPKRIAIELKRSHGGNTTVEQDKWLNDLNAAGWTTAICHGSEQAIRFIKEELKKKAEDDLWDQAFKQFDRPTGAYTEETFTKLIHEAARPTKKETPFMKLMRLKHQGRA